MWMPKEVNFLLALEDHYNLYILYLHDKQTNAHFYICSNLNFILHQPVAVTPVTFM